MDTAPNHHGLPGNAAIVATPDVWLEGEAIRQLARTAADPDCVAAVGMPDLHPGPGLPIGAAFGFARTVRPRLVGSDAGCGALLVSLARVKVPGNLEQRVRAEFDHAPLPDVDTAALLAAVWRAGVAGLTADDLPASLAALAELLADFLASGQVDDIRPGALPDDYGARFGAALGTIGGGNHFAELGRVTEIRDREAADALGLRRGALVVLAHSGSRGLGKAIADRWADRTLTADRPGADAAADAYLGELAGAIGFARANRAVLAWRMLRALGAARPGKLAAAVDVVHNSVVHEQAGNRALWVHRKGCAPAHSGQVTVVLGSRGAPSWVMRGRGCADGLCSVAHGAGRKMQRSEARDKLRARYRRKELSRSASGGRVVCDDPRLLYEEHPDAYKPIEPVIESLERGGLADRIAAVEPLVTVKK